MNSTDPSTSSVGAVPDPSSLEDSAPGSSKTPETRSVGAVLDELEADARLELETRAAESKHGIASLPAPVPLRENGDVSFRSLLYAIAKALGDANAVKRNRVPRRIARRVYGKATGKLARRWFG